MLSHYWHWSKINAKRDNRFSKKSNSLSILLGIEDHSNDHLCSAMCMKFKHKIDKIRSLRPLFFKHCDHKSMCFFNKGHLYISGVSCHYCCVIVSVTFITFEKKNFSRSSTAAALLTNSLKGNDFVNEILVNKIHLIRRTDMDFNFSGPSDCSQIFRRPFSFAFPDIHSSQYCGLSLKKLKTDINKTVSASLASSCSENLSTQYKILTFGYFSRDIMSKGL